MVGREPSLHDVLLESFNSEELLVICAEHFREVYQQYTPGMTKSQLARLLIDYCAQRGGGPELMRIIVQERPHLASTTTHLERELSRRRGRLRPIEEPAPPPQLVFGVVALLGVFGVLALWQFLASSSTLRCDPAEDGEQRIVVAQFYRAPGVQNLNQEQRLFDELSEGAIARVQICRSTETADDRLEARGLAERYDADILVWGRLDVKWVELSIEAPEWNWPDHGLRPQKTADMLTASFDEDEPAVPRFFALLSLSQLQYLQGDSLAARETMELVLDEAPASIDDQDLAEAYFVLGLLFMTTDSTKHDNERALAAYTRAISLNETFDSALLNRAAVYQSLGRADLAIADYTMLISSSTEMSMVVAAYIGRSDLQPSRALAEPDLAEAVRLSPLEGLLKRGSRYLQEWHEPELALADFERLVALDADELFYRHYLAMSQVVAGKTDAAIETYQQSLALMTEEDHSIFIADIGALVDLYPESEAAISTVQDALSNSARK